MDEVKIKVLTQEQKEHLKTKTALSLPDNPSNAGFSAKQIKQQLSVGNLELFEMLKRTQEDVNDALDKMVSEDKNLHADIENVAKYVVQEKERAIQAENNLDKKIDNLSNETANNLLELEKSLKTELEDYSDSNLNSAKGYTDSKSNDVLVQAKQYTDEKSVKMYKAKGSVMNYYELPTENQVGDVYNIVNADKEHGIDAGDNVVWTDKGTWDKLGGNYDHKPIFDNINYIGTGGIKAMSGYNQDTGEITLELFDFVNPEYDEDTGVLTINAELKELN